MKKLIIALVLFIPAIPLFAQQSGPVYVNGLLGPYICEFAENGSSGERYAPFINNGRLYFCCPAKLIGNRNNRLEFSLSDNLEHKIRGIYSGEKINVVSSDEGRLVAGYAEKGKIIITHVFLNYETFAAWSETVKLAFK